MRELNTVENFLLLAYNTKGYTNFNLVRPLLNAGIMCSLVLDLRKNKNTYVLNNRVFVKQNSNISDAHSYVLGLISKKKNGVKTKRIIEFLLNRSKRIRRMVLADVERKGIFHIQKRKFLFTINQRITLSDISLREELIQEILDSVLERNDVNVDSNPILGIIAAINLHKEVSNDREQLIRLYDALKHIPVSDPIIKYLKKILRSQYHLLVPQARIMNADKF